MKAAVLPNQTTQSIFKKLRLKNLDQEKSWLKYLIAEFVTVTIHAGSWRCRTTSRNSWP